MISNVIRQTDNNFIFLESSHSETTASGKSVEVTSHSSQMEPHQVGQCFVSISRSVNSYS